MALSYREQRVIEMREQGMTFDEIGRQFTISRTRAAQIWHEARAKLGLPKVRAAPVQPLSRAKQHRFMGGVMGPREADSKPKLSESPFSEPEPGERF